MEPRVIIGVLLMAGLAGCSDGGRETADTAGSKARSEVELNVETCRAAAGELGGALKSALLEAMKDGGPQGALNVCHDEAQAIADRICDQEQLTVRRTSRRMRNPANAPDEWEQAGLAAFDARIAEGENPEDLEMWATVTGPAGERTFRYLKAIPTARMCLVCHGSELAGDLEEKLAELYPGDQARGFAVGDLRGAFTVKMDLPEAGPAQ
jgi:hypothetical protein